LHDRAGNLSGSGHQGALRGSLGLSAAHRVREEETEAGEMLDNVDEAVIYLQSYYLCRLICHLWVSVRPEKRK